MIFMFQSKDAIFWIALLGFAVSVSTGFISPKPPSYKSFRVWGQNEGNDGAFDMSELQNRIDKQRNQYHDFLMEDDDGSVTPEIVYIIIFNAGTEEQGVHSIEFPKGSGHNILLAFESSDECADFAEMLTRDQIHFQNPLSLEYNLEELKEYCNDDGVPVKVVPKGTMLKPPPDTSDDVGPGPSSSRDNNQQQQVVSEDDVEVDDEVIAARKLIKEAQEMSDQLANKGDEDSLECWQ